MSQPDPLAELEALLADWPTMRALSALGAKKATARKARARQIVAHLRHGAPLAPASPDHWQEG